MKRIIILSIICMTLLSLGITTYCCITDRGISSTITLQAASFDIDINHSSFKLESLRGSNPKTIDIDIKNTWSVRRRIYRLLLSDIVCHRLDAFNNVYMSVQKVSNDGSLIDTVPYRRMSYYIQINDVTPGFLDDTGDRANDDAIYLEPNEECRLRLIFVDKSPDSRYNEVNGSFKIRLCTEQSFTKSGNNKIMDLLVSNHGWSMGIEPTYIGETKKILQNYELHVIKPENFSIRNTVNHVEVRNMDNNDPTCNSYSFEFTFDSNGVFDPRFGGTIFTTTPLPAKEGKDRGFLLDTQRKINSWKNIYFTWKIKNIGSSGDFTEVISMPIHME